MLVALALVMGIFVWREQTRPTVVAQQPLPVPSTVTVPAANPTALPEPTPAGVGFRPTYLAVGPAAPSAHGEQSLQPTPPSGDPAVPADTGLFPGEEGEAAPASASSEAEMEEADRAAILERMSQASESGPAGEPGELFPTEGEQPAAPVRVKGAEAAPKPQPKPEPRPVAKPVPTAATAATAADLFPIDEELPLKPGKPKSTASSPAAATQPAAAVVVPPAPAPVAPPSDGYRIDEPSL
jgi:hypothetical protein